MAQLSQSNWTKLKLQRKVRRKQSTND